MKKLVILSFSVLLISCNPFLVNNSSLRFNDYYTRSLMVELPVVIKGKQTDIVIMFDDMIDVLVVDGYRYTKSKRMIRDALIKHHPIHVSDTIDCYWIGEVVPSSYVDSIYNKGIDFYFDYYVNNYAFNYERVRSNSNDLPYILSLFYHEGYSISVSCEWGGLLLSKHDYSA